ncbi:hypothetical protein CMO93_05335 [Candidatus Woesearchaeota archaeon]|nr:hypothetical protein [Candidatus Woesearchaeota archaeon]|tara:strand:- start:307 stop:2322 length:2016 start_codon:yes stop_codon:yes gene_type:complete
MVNKRGQVTIFFVIAITILLSLLVFFYYKSSITKNDIPNYKVLDVNPIKIYIDSCLEVIGREALYKVGQQGGYVEIPDNIKIHNTSYWYVNGVNIQPFLSEIEVRINQYVENKLHTCLNLTIFERQGFEIEFEDLDVNTQINKKDIIIKTKYPIKIQKKDSISKISEFIVKFNIRLMDMYEVATDIVNQATLPVFNKCDPHFCNNSLDVNIELFNFKEDLLVKSQTIEITDDEKMIPYNLNFVIKRPIKEAFEENNDSLNLAVLYQDQSNTPSFGKKSLEVLNKIVPSNKYKVDIFNCDETSIFFDNSDKYDILMITGNQGFVIVVGSDRDAGLLIAGCREIRLNYKEELKNWINSGGIMWINFAESSLNYIDTGYSYRSTKLFTLATWQEDVKEWYVSQYKKSAQINNPDHQILNCPNEIDLSTVGFGTEGPSIEETNAELVVGTKDDPEIWTQRLGNGLIVFDQVLMKDNLLKNSNIKGDIYSGGLAESYFINTLNFLAAEKEKSVEPDPKFTPNLTYPINNIEITSPEFYFEIEDSDGINEYIIQINYLNGSLLKESAFIRPQYIPNRGFIVFPFSKQEFNSIIPQILEWKIASNNGGKLHWGKIEKFTVSHCGNNICEPNFGENKCLCPADCGACEGVNTITCERNECVNNVCISKIDQVCLGENNE